MHTILIFGPVSADQIQNKLKIPSGWQVRFFSKAPAPSPEFYENGSEAFAHLAKTWGPNPLNTLAPGAGRIFLGSFSAGYGAVEEIFLKHHAGDPRLAGVASADSYYTSRGAPPHTGFLTFAKYAAAGAFPFLMTSSTVDGPKYDSSSSCVKKLAEAIGATTTDTGHPYTWGKGSWIWNDMGGIWTHTHHATTGLPDMLNYLMGYEVATKTGTPHNQGSSSLSDMLPYFGVAALGYLLTKGKLS